MEILEQRVEVLASQAVYDTTIRTNYLPAEIIAMCKDGTSESTNPESLRLRNQAIGLSIIDSYLAGRAELEPEVERLKAELECSNGDFRQLEAMKGRLESDLKAASAEVERLRWVDHEDILKGRAEIARLRTEVLEAQEARDRFKAERDTLRCKLAAITRALSG